MQCTIFIPVYNEEKLIIENTKRLMEFLAAQNITYEIFIGNNGPTDATLERARNLQKKHPKRIRVLHSPVRDIGSVFIVSSRGLCSVHIKDEALKKECIDAIEARR